MVPTVYQKSSPAPDTGLHAHCYLQVAPVMSIQFAGQTFWLNVQMGEGGLEVFKADVKRLLNLSSEDEFDITFECLVPGEGRNVYPAACSATCMLCGTAERCYCLEQYLIPVCCCCCWGSHCAGVQYVVGCIPGRLGLLVHTMYLHMPAPQPLAAMHNHACHASLPPYIRHTT